MQLFYGSVVSEGLAVLSESETRHCMKVLRKGKGDEIRLTDGKGQLFRGRILDGHKKGASVQIIELIESKATPETFVNLAFAPTKNSSRFEWLLEKAVEVGVKRLLPFVGMHSERRKINSERSAGIVLSAMKQSGRLWLPEWLPLQKLSDAIPRVAAEENSLKIAAAQSGEIAVGDLDAGGREVWVFIGPEGDFSEQEYQLMHENGFIFVTLGDFRLRTETAGLVALTLLNSAIQNKK
jgi:16S rRNA (uracil1498-N3)-methyltransferase